MKKLSREENIKILELNGQKDLDQYNDDEIQELVDMINPQSEDKKPEKKIQAPAVKKE